MSDAYYTPDDVADLMTDAVARIIGARWCEMDCVVEPHAGGGALVRAAKRQWPGLSVLAGDIDYHAPGLYEADAIIADNWLTAEFLDYSLNRIIIMNPPFSGHCGLPHVQKAIGVRGPDGVVCALLPLSFLSSKGRADFLAAHPPTQVTVLSGRPRWGGPLTQGMSGRQDMAIFVWAAGVRPMPLRRASCA